MTEISVQFRYFDLDHAIATHSYVIEKSGGLCGVKNQGAIESIIAHVQNDDYYPDLIDKMTYLVYGINKNHAFNDGNKRASIALSSFFLGLNEHDFAIPQYTRGMEEVAVWLACSLVDDVCLKRIIRFLLYDDEFRIFNFIMECKKYRLFIEREKNLISKKLLSEMIDVWLSEEMEFSNELKIRIFDVIYQE